MGTLWVPVDDGGQKAQEKPLCDRDEGQQAQVIEQYQPDSSAYCEGAWHFRVLEGEKRGGGSMCYWGSREEAWAAGETILDTREALSLQDQSHILAQNSRPKCSPIPTSTSLLT